MDCTTEDQTEFPDQEIRAECSPDSDSPATNEISVLLIDASTADSSTIRHLLSRAEQAKYRITRAKNLKAAAALLEQQAFDVALLDYRLDSGYGLAFLSTLQNAKTSVPVLVISEYESSDLTAVSLTDIGVQVLPIAQLSQLALEQAIHGLINR